MNMECNKAETLTGYSQLLLQPDALQTELQRVKLPTVQAAQSSITQSQR